MKYVEKKGTRVIVCSIISNIGDGQTPQEVDQDFVVDGIQYNSREEARAAYWGWYGNYGDTSEEGIKKQFKICESNKLLLWINIIMMVLILLYVILSINIGYPNTVYQLKRWGKSWFSIYN